MLPDTSKPLTTELQNVMLWCPYTGVVSFYQYCEKTTNTNIKQKHPHKHRPDFSCRGKLEMFKIATILLISHYTAAMGIWNHTEIILTIQDLNLFEIDAFWLYFAFQTTFWHNFKANQSFCVLALPGKSTRAAVDDAKQSPNVNIFSSIKKPNQTKNPSI